MKKHEWKTPTGKTITMTTEEITEREINADGDKVTVKDDYILITEVTLDGKKYRGDLTKHQGKPALDLGTQVVNGKKMLIVTIIPQEIYQAVWGAYDERQTAKIEAEMKEEAEYQKHREAMRKVMGY